MINSIRSMMKFFVVLFASACLVAVVFADFDFDRYNRLDEEISRNLKLALDRALAADDIDTCKTCWKYFGVISKYMRTNSKTPPTDSTIRMVCQALRFQYDIDGDCASFLKAAYTNLTNYMGNQLDPSRVCPAALHCKPTEQYQAMMAYGSVREDSIGTCTLCKMWAKVVVTVIKEYAKEGTDKLRSELLMYCNRVTFAPLRRMCRAGVEALVEHIPQILKGGPDEVCKLLKAC